MHEFCDKIIMVASKRKKIILALLESLGRGVTAKCMQKYLFIFSRSQMGERIYDFVPYRYGCFSFQANQDLISLEKNGYIAIKDVDKSDKEYILLHQYHAILDLDMFERQKIDEVCQFYGKMSQNELIAYTYRRWPYTAINSVIKQYILNSDELEAVNMQKAKLNQSDQMLFTVGYEGFSLEKFLNRLIRLNVHTLVDVRKNAFSMKYGFSKSILEKACNGVNIKYIHIPELGIESSKRQTLEDQNDYDELFDDYESTTLRNNWNSLLLLHNIVESDNRVCLMCFEKDPRQCHRTRIAKALMSLPQHKYNLKEIFL